MAKKKADADIENNESMEQPPMEAGFEMVVNAQYIKDLSFENPRPIEALMSQEAPNVEVAIHVNAEKINPEEKDEDPSVFEVSLIVQARAVRNDEPIFVIELNYAGVFSFKGIDKMMLHPVLMIECPRLLFPYARNIVSDLTRDGNFPPLMLKPVDFADLYRQRMMQMSEDIKGNA